MQILDTGVIYRNPKAHVHSIHAYFPSVIKLSNGELLASFNLGEAFESSDLHTYLSRSSDNGKTWTFQGELLERKSGGIYSDTCRLTALPDGGVAAFVIRHNRTDHPEDGLANPENVGFVPTELLLMRSDDFGKTFSAPTPLNPSVVGPEFEMCSPITILSDGTWALPTSTWKDWEGNLADGARMVALVSEDQGQTWPRHMEVMNSVSEKLIYWESKIVELPDGTLLAVAWGYDEPNAADLPNQFAVSRDRGQTWSKPKSMGILGQTLTPLLLPDGDVLCVYRRIDEPGLWASRCRVNGDDFEVIDSLPLWGWSSSNLTGNSANMAVNFSVLRFGAPTCLALDSKTMMVAFWCYEDCVSNIRWIKLEH
jgi:hypothetical protein